MSRTPILRIELSPSRRLACAIAVVHGLAALAVAVTVGGGVGAVLAVLVIGLGAAIGRERALLRGARAVRAVEIAPGGQAVVELRSGERAQLGPGARFHVNRHWVTLPAGAPVHRTILVASDMAVPEELRRLRLWALWGNLPMGRAA